MYRNFEYGLCIKERRLVKKIAEDFRRYATLGAPINPLKFPQLKKAIAELREIKAQLDTQLEEKSVKLSKTFESKRQAVHEQLLVARAEGMSPNAAFADTILYLLKQAPTSTEELYPAIQNIHPELCDDTVKLVIKGKEWGQPKWRHQIRHLQQSLKKQGRIKRGKKASGILPNDRKTIHLSTLTAHLRRPTFPDDSMMQGSTDNEVRAPAVFRYGNAAPRSKAVILFSSISGRISRLLAGKKAMSAAPLGKLISRSALPPAMR